MTRQSTAATAAREDARQHDGRFGVQPVPEATVVSLEEFDWADVDETAQLFDIGYKASRRASRATGAADRGYSVDDVAQDAFVAVLERRAKGKSIDNIHAYVNKAASNAAAKAGRSVPSGDFAAYRIFQERSAEMVAATGRALTSQEEDALATEIRDGWHDPRHKPSTDFVQNVRGRERLSDDIVNSDHFQALHQTDTVVNDVRPGSYLDRALDGVEGEERNLREARKMLWNAMAERHGAPIIDKPHLGHRGVTHARATIKPDSDVTALVAAWEDETLDADTERALFAPWETDDVRDRAAIANVLSATPEYSYGIWDAALRAATKPR